MNSATSEYLLLTLHEVEITCLTNTISEGEYYLKNYSDHVIDKTLFSLLLQLQKTSISP
jgi:hypothetical protein